MSNIKLRNIVRSAKEGKKWDAVFEVDGREKRVSFGAAGMSDYTINKDPRRRELYLRRHRVTEDWNDPLTPGALSRWILWENPSFDRAVQMFRKRFGV
jgi:hypothetical protein